MVSRNNILDFMEEVGEIVFWVGDSETGVYWVDSEYEYDLYTGKWNLLHGRYEYVVKMSYTIEDFLSDNRGNPICINDDVRSPRAGNVLINTIPSDFVRD